MISTRPELLVELHESVSGQLISRFKEREENVRLDVLACYTELLKATASDTHNQIHNVDAKPSSETLLTDDKIGAIISAGNKLMGQKGTIKTKTAIFTLLRQLTLAAPGRLESFTSMLVPSLTEALAEKSSALKLEALCFLRLLLETHEPTVLQSHMAEVIPLVLTCVGEDWYKSVAEALRVVAAITQAIRPYDEESGLFKGDFDFSPFVTAIFQVPPWGPGIVFVCLVNQLHVQAIFPRLQAHDIDQEIKETAIISMGIVVYHFADHFKSELDSVLPLLMERLHNEITRMPTLKAIAAIASSPLKVDLTSVLSDVVTELGQFLRQHSRYVFYKGEVVHNDLFCVQCFETNYVGNAGCVSVEQWVPHVQRPICIGSAGNGQPHQ